jgi:hypothetical protein
MTVFCLIFSFVILCLTRAMYPPEENILK